MTSERTFECLAVAPAGFAPGRVVAAASRAGGLGLVALPPGDWPEVAPADVTSGRLGYSRS